MRPAEGAPPFEVVARWWSRVLSLGYGVLGTALSVWVALGAPFGPDFLDGLVPRIAGWVSLVLFVAALPKIVHLAVRPGPMFTLEDAGYVDRRNSRRDWRVEWHEVAALRPRGTHVRVVLAEREAALARWRPGPWLALVPRTLLARGLAGYGTERRPVILTPVGTGVSADDLYREMVLRHARAIAP